MSVRIGRVVTSGGSCDSKSHSHAWGNGGVCVTACESTFWTFDSLSGKGYFTYFRDRFNSFLNEKLLD